MTAPTFFRARQVTTSFAGVAGRGEPLTVVRGGFLVDGEAPRPKSPPPELGEHMDEIFGPMPDREERYDA